MVASQRANEAIIGTVIVDVVRLPLSKAIAIICFGIIRVSHTTIIYPTINIDPISSPWMSL